MATLDRAEASPGPGRVAATKAAPAAERVEPVDGTRYHPPYERSEILGDDNYERARADGTINIVDDILGVAQQFGQNCAFQ